MCWKEQWDGTICGYVASCHLVSILHVNHSLLHTSVINIVTVTTHFCYLSAVSSKLFLS